MSTSTTIGETRQLVWLITGASTFNLQNCPRIAHPRVSAYPSLTSSSNLQVVAQA